MATTEKKTANTPKKKVVKKTDEQNENIVLPENNNNTEKSIENTLETQFKNEPVINTPVFGVEKNNESPKFDKQQTHKVIDNMGIVYSW